MTHHKSKKTASKADKLNFFNHKGAPALQTSQPEAQDGDRDLDSSSTTPVTDPTRSENITKEYLTQALDMLSNKLMAANNGRHQKRDARDRNNDIADHFQSLEEKVELLETRIADAEDRARRNNLRLRGVPVSVLHADLQAYTKHIKHMF
ncbi:Hypothetical predicted protein [Pelobates cultripes]|uniref:Uncharacterized protein n=1 Tax=Pelobates cultripes TaxID=61616 RepID=A0AAD1R0M0_PELCU|nr:Hypothetical predicted protein [Pelobates cultripes]